MSNAVPQRHQIAGSPPAQTDFTSMTRAELFDWMNGKIAGGEMSLDQSSAFLGMTIKIPVEAGQATWRPIDDNERINVLQIAKDGIEAALARNDDVTGSKLEAALQFMPETGVDRRA